MKTIKEIPDFDLSKIPEGPTEKAREIMTMLDERTFIIDQYGVNEYESFIMKLYFIMLEGFEHKEFRDHPVMFKFKKEDKEVHHMPFRHFILNTVFWYPMKWLDSKNLDESFIVHPSEMYKISPIMIKEYMDDKYITVYNKFIPDMPDKPITEINSILNTLIGMVNFLFSRTSAYFSKFFGISVSIHTFRDLANRIPEAKELFNFKLDESKQPAEMEHDLQQAQNALIKIIQEDTEFNQFKPLIQPKAGLNLKQLRDLCINIGLKPDQDGRTIAKPINTNFLMGGLSDPVSYYIGAIPGRKAAIINYEFMGRTGHLLILIAISTASVRLSRTVDDCQSMNPVPMEIKSEKHLQRLDGRTYRHRGSKQYKTINFKKDKDLIGETILVRSPATCCAPDGVCKTCYGNLYYTNIDNYSPGVFSATYVMNPVVQGILSAKHHQTTNTTEIKFDEEFYNFFSISSTDIIVDPSHDIIISDYCLVIERAKLMSSEGDEDELDFDYTTKKRKRKRKVSAEAIDIGEGFEGLTDEDSEGGGLELKLPYYVESFKVARYLNNKKHETEYYEFSDMENKELFMHMDFIRRMIPDNNEELGDFLYIPLEDIPSEEFVFVVDVYNNELTKPMKSIQKVLNSKDHEGCDTYEEIINKMLDLMIASKLDAASVHAEMIIRQLIRRSNNKLRRPDFNRIIMRQDYQLLSIGSALKENPSITTSLSTPFLKDQLVSMVDTYKKTAVSVFDDLFKQRLV